MKTPARSFGPARIRLLNVVAACLLVVGATGWWMTTRVLNADGFADVMAKSLHDQPVRDYVADLITLRLARDTSIVAAARPIVRSAVSAALDTAPVEAAVRSGAQRAHRQAFRSNGAAFAEIDALQASAAVRIALESINPDLAAKLPPNVLQASTRVAQSAVLQNVVSSARWIRWLFGPVLVVGAAMMVMAVARAKNRTRALHSAGASLAVGGALLAGMSLAGPTYAWLTDGVESSRADAIVALVERFLGRLQGAGVGMIAVGLVVATAPGRDGADLRDRWHRTVQFVRQRTALRRWRLATSAVLVLASFLLLTKPRGVLAVAVAASALVSLHVGVLLALRTSNMLSPAEYQTARLRPRTFVAVAATMAVSAVATGSGALAVVASAGRPTKVSAKVGGCNGYIELCYLRLNQMMFPGSHNSMSSSAANFLSAEHTIPISEQLNAGARLLMLDLYYGYDDHGLIRTNLAGGAPRAQILAEQGADAVAALDRFGALTGSVDTSGKKKDVYLCHDYCELGASKAAIELAAIRDFLVKNRNEVVILDLEDYVTPTDIKLLLQQTQLIDRVWIPDPKATDLPYLADFIDPERNNGTENNRRLIVLSEKHGGEYPWLIPAYSLLEETPYTFKTIAEFSCTPNRGGTGKPLFLLNHWLRTTGVPSPAKAKETNSAAELTRRIQQCATERHRLPNLVATDFTEVGDLYRTATKFNAATAVLAGVTATIDVDLAQERQSGTLSPAELQDIADLRRLPTITEQEALSLAGPSVAIAKTPLSEILDTSTTTSTTIR